MDNDLVLDLAGLTLTLAYAALMVWGLVITRGGGQTTLRRLTAGVRICRAAVAVAAVDLLVQALDIPNDDPIWLLLWVFNLGSVVYCSVLMRRRRDLKGEQVVADAERTVRYFRHPLDQGM